MKPCVVFGSTTLMTCCSCSVEHRWNASEKPKYWNRILHRCQQCCLPRIEQELPCNWTKVFGTNCMSQSATFVFPLMTATVRSSDAMQMERPYSLNHVQALFVFPALCGGSSFSTIRIYLFIYEGLCPCLLANPVRPGGGGVYIFSLPSHASLSPFPFLWFRSDFGTKGNRNLGNEQQINSNSCQLIVATSNIISVSVIRSYPNIFKLYVFRTRCSVNFDIFVYFSVQSIISVTCALTVSPDGIRLSDARKNTAVSLSQICKYRRLSAVPLLIKYF